MLILGTAQLRGRYGVVGRPESAVSDIDAHALLTCAAQIGFAAVDTAPAYDDAEQLIGTSGIEIPVHTKLDPSLEPEESLTRSLERLKRERVSLLYFHTADVALHDPADRIARAKSLVGSRVGALGVSVYETKEFVAAVDDGRFGAVQVPVSALDRRIAPEVLARARASGVAVFARSVLLQGILAAPPDAIPAPLAPLVPFVQAVHRVAFEAQLSVLTLVIAWVRDLPGISGLVVGARDAQELDDLVGAWSSPPLPGAVREAIDTLPPPPDALVDPRRWPN
jgi:aryl-alcohol dehydrogenase-like predicted oxidoreductase